MFGIKLFFYDPSWMLQLSDFVWALRSLVWIVFNNFLLIDATDRSKISSDQKRLFFALRLYPLSFFASTPFNACLRLIEQYYFCHLWLFHISALVIHVIWTEILSRIFKLNRLCFVSSFRIHQKKSLNFLKVVRK